MSWRQKVKNKQSFGLFDTTGNFHLEVPDVASIILADMEASKLA
jgi:hypothetical protein